MSEPKLLTKEELNTRLMTLGTSHPAAKEVILHIAAQEKIIENLQAQNSDYEESFKMRCRADERAIKRWEKESPHERKLKMPDHVDLVIWLGEGIENLEEQLCTALLANADLAEKFSGMMETIEGQRKALSKIEFYAESLPCKGDNCDDYNYLPCSRCSIKSLAKSALNEGKEKHE